MPPEYDVFISYSRHDGAFAVRLEQALEPLRVFRDQSTMSGGEPWLSQVVDAVYGSRLVVALLSPEYLASAICRAELFHALSRDPDGHARIVLPVLVKPVPLPDAVRLINVIDATDDGATEGSMARLRSAVDGALGAPTPPIPPPGIEDARLALAVELRPDAGMLVRTLRMARRALANLETRAAGYTSVTLPPTLEIELEDKRAEVAALEERIRRLVV